MKQIQNKNNIILIIIIKYTNKNKKYGKNRLIKAEKKVQI